MKRNSIIFGCAVVILAATTSAQSPRAPGTESPSNKRTVEAYFDGFRKSDHKQILACLTDDVEWIIPGMFRVTGKAAFDKEIENEAFVGRPNITITRTVEDKDVVVVEGSVRSEKKTGGNLNVVFCDVFVMQDGKIRQLTSYLMELK
jgi:ketosteroid isomerase-like protein